MAVRLSNLQFAMLKVFAIQKAGSYYMTEEEAQSFDQRPFRSMLMRRYVSYHPGHGFFITPEGRQAWREFEMTELMRRNAHLPLTSYFNPLQYPRRTALRLFKRSAAA